MHYLAGGTPVIHSSHTSTDAVERELERRCKRDILPKIPTTSYKEERGPFPLQYDTSPWTVAGCLLPHADGSSNTSAVYILECTSNGNPATTAIETAVSGNSVKSHTGAASAPRLFYVGVASNVHRRLCQHLNSPGDEGAYFTAMYPPVSVRHVEWFPNYQLARRAEPIIADVLDDHFADAYVAQPG
jgi:hypothetical protein